MQATLSRTIAHASITALSMQAHHDEMRTSPGYRSVEAVLRNAFRAAASSGTKTAKLGEFTSPESSGIRLTLLEQMGDAAWVFRLLESHLDASQRAWVYAAFDGMGPARSGAIATLALHFDTISPNRGLMAGLVTHHLDENEPYQKSAREIARDADVSETSARRAKAKVIDAMEAMREAVYDKLRPAFERRGRMARA